MDNKKASGPWDDINSGEDIVISGIAGRFPHSDNMNELRENLFNKVNLSTPDHTRWNIDHPEVPKNMGTINNVDKFDAEFFGLSFQHNTLSPDARKLLEISYEAIIDAGINPKQLRGKNTAVIIGATYIETQQLLMYISHDFGGQNVIGCSKSTLANMISNYLDLKGPSYVVDTACSSSLYAMTLGYHLIMSGECEDAIIGTSNLCFQPIVNLQFSRLGVLALDGCCRPFDDGGNGYSRSESVSVLYLQKAKNAKRIYAVCPYIKLNNDGYKEEGIVYPSMLMQSTLLTEFYNECKIPSSCLDYVEAHATGTKAGDLPEINAIYDSLCKNREKLMVGSVKSNLGHAEPASGFTQIAKTIIAFESGFVPPNINYDTPRSDIDALVNGTICVVQEPFPLKNGYIGINSFGFGGSNAHMLLKWNTKQKVNNGAPNDDLPRLVTLSGRTEKSVILFLNDVVNLPIDVEYIRLLHDIHADSIDGHPWRGYTILKSLQDNSIKEIENCENVKRPIWFIFSALGSFWPGMGQNLLKFHVFAHAISMCDVVLKPYDISVTDILIKMDEEVCALYAFVGIVAVQIGLVDLLTSLGIIPDYMISHSGGELGCAYADKCLTLEQTILAAYFIGLTCSEGEVIRSSMAVVTFDHKCLKSICPIDIEIICHNSENSSVVSGPTRSVEDFMEKLQVNNIYVKRINCNVPYHSSYLAFAETQLSLSLNKLIPRPKKRSSKWISTSVPRTEWHTSTSELSSADYHTRSILNTVLFEQATHLIPCKAVTIEIAPDGFLKHVLKESLHPEVTNVLMTQHMEHNVDVILQGIGRLYNSGLQPQVANLYPPVEYPVSRGTSMISPSIRWDYSEDWFIPQFALYELNQSMESRERHLEISLQHEDYNYMSGHVIDGRNLIPAMGYLELVWETMGMIKYKIFTKMPITFRDVKFIRATRLSQNDAVTLTITIQTDGKFEISEGDSAVMTGTVYETFNPEQEMTSMDLLTENIDEEEHMTARDVYKELKLRGYQYKGQFRGLNSASISGNKGHIIWRKNWATFMDNMLQMHMIGYDTRDLYVPTSIQKVMINPALHACKLQSVADNVEATTEVDKQIPIRIYREIDTIIAGGVEIQGVKGTPISRRKLPQDAVVEEYTFVAHCDGHKISLNEAIRISAQLVLEDHPVFQVKAVELVEDEDDVELEYLSSSLLLEALDDLPLIQTNITLLTSSNRFKPEDLSRISIGDLNKPSVDDKVSIVAGFNLLTKPESSLKHLLSFLKEGGYLLTREMCDVTEYKKYLQEYKLNVILEKRTDKEMIVLLKKKVVIGKRSVIFISNDNFNWLEDLKQLLGNEKKHEENSRIIIVGERDFECGLLGFINCLRKEPGGELVRGVLIQDMMAPKFSLEDPFYLQQLQKDMAINVLRHNNTWGSYRHLRLLRLEAEPVPTAHVSQMVQGDLRTFRWVENNLSVEYRREDLVHVVYSSLNFKDVMTASGKLMKDISRGRLFQNVSLGLEYVGLDVNGQRVMGICETNGIANVVVKKEDFCWKVPDAWTLEEAATVPCVYGTVYLALYIYGKIRKGDKILIHSGAGGVGQAAIHVALYEGCEVFTTVGTRDKRDFIKKIFPNIEDEHIGNSRDTSFEQMIMRQTNGRGVDIVLNSLAEEKLLASVRCLARNGRFLEIGKFDLISNNPLNISEFQKGINFYGVLLDRVLTMSDHKYKSLVTKMVENGLKNGAIKPIQATVFTKMQIEEAFRHMASGNHMGKILINVCEKDEPLNQPITAYRRYYCLKDKCYIIIGGLGGIGLELTEWLIFRGAKHVVLISRTGVKNGYQRMKIRLWESYGVNVLIIKDLDVANPKDCQYILETAEREAPVDAIFNLAVVLKDGILKNQSVESFAESFQSKARATQTFDKLTRTMCPKLRHFVVFSSVVCGKGNPGQTNYGMANSVMERVCEKRTEDGLHGLAIQWGAVGDVGIVADMQEVDKELVIGGTLQQKISCCLDELDKFLLQSRPIVSSMVVAEKKGGISGFGSAVDAVLNILGIKDIKTVSQHSTLAELGMDSMTAVEIKQTLEREYDIFLTAEELRNLTLAKLIKMTGTNVNKDNMQDKEDYDIEDIIKHLLGVVRDEDFVSQTCLDLSTERQNTTTEVFLIPGINGCGTVFDYLAPSIKFSATSFNYHTNSIDATNILLDTTDHLINDMLAKLRDGKNFVMVGYSFGSIIAIELTRKLEAMNYEGRLVLIDGAPEQMKALYEISPSHFSDAMLQIITLTRIMEINFEGNGEKILMDLKKCNTWEERYDMFATQFLAMNASLSPVNLKTLCTSVYKYLSALVQYDPATLPPIKSPITLLKPTQPLPIPTEEDYGLQKVTQSVAKVHYIEGTHATILKDEKVSAAINGEPPFDV